eukprot:798824-Alexandrium_andersonii.AAC.1
MSASASASAVLMLSQFRRCIARLWTVASANRRCNSRSRFCFSCHCVSIVVCFLLECECGRSSLG